MNNRTLDNDFEDDLRSGILHELLAYVQNDDTLMLATRGTYITIYYRGGRILEIKQEKDLDTASGKVYTASFNSSYAEGIQLPYLPREFTSAEEWGAWLERHKDLKCADDVRTWLEALPRLKYIMDVYFHKNRACEREIQQHIARENNDSPSSQQTNYFVADIERTENEHSNCRFDMLAFCWPRSKRQSGSRKVSLALVELKYGDGSLNGPSGIVEHFQQYVDLVESADTLNELYNDSKKQINQLVRLGIFNHSSMNEDFQVDVLEKQPEFILIFASDNVHSTILENELGNLERHPDFTKYKDKVKFYIGIAGYALYQKCLCNFENFMLYRKCLHNPDNCMSKLRRIEEDSQDMAKRRNHP